MWWRFWVANVLHAGVNHLAGNMLPWLVIGTMIERIAGHERMALLTIAGAAGCSVGALMVDPDVVGIGASGVVFAAFGFAAMLDPDARRPIGKFGWSLVVLGIGLSTFTPGISSGGHVGGVLAGFASGIVLVYLVRAVWPMPAPTSAMTGTNAHTNHVDRTAPLAANRELPIAARLNHLAARRDAGQLSVDEFDRLQHALVTRG